MVTTTTNIQKKRREEATVAAQSRRQMSREVQRNLLRVGLDAPVESKENAASTSQNITKAVLQRQQALERWRQERAAKRQAEQRHQKPVFKCGKAQDTHRQTMMVLPPLKDSNSDNGFQHVRARVDSGLKNLTANIQFATTSKQPIIFTGTSENYLTSDEEDIQDKAKQKLAANKTANRAAASQTRRAVLPSRPKKEDPKSKAPIRSIGSKPVKQSVAGKPERKPMLMKAIPTDKTLTRQTVAEESKISEESRALSPSTPRRSSVRKSGTPAPVKKISLPPSTVTPDAKKTELRTPINKLTSTLKTPRSRVNKRAAPDDEDLVTDDESFSLGCTPSGKVRCVDDGKPLPVIRKSFEILRLKTTEERVAALMQSPMVEFRKRRSCVTSDASSPCGQSLLSEEEQNRRDERLEMRAEVMQKMAEDYAKSPEARLEEGSPLKRMDPASAQKIRRKSRLLQEAFTCSARKSGQPVTALSAHHFRCLLSDETTRLDKLRAKWEPLSFDIDIPSNAQAEIAAVIGQTELLFRHKFFFYEQMITKHESGASGGRGALEGRLVTAEDLLGYWELMHLEIDNLDARYVRLTEWQAAGWAGALSDLQGGASQAESKRSPPRKKITKPKRAVKKPVTSKFAAFRAQMKKKANEEETDTAESVEMSGSGESVSAKITQETFEVDANPLGKTTLQDTPLQSKTTPRNTPLLAKTTPQNTPGLSKGTPLDTPLLSKGTPLGTPRLAKTAPLHTRPLVNTPPLRSQSGAPLRSALKSGRRQASRQSAAVRFAPSSPSGEETRTPSTPAPVVVRQGTPYREKRVTARRTAAAVSAELFASPQRRPLRSRSASLHAMPASPRATSPDSGEVTGRPKTGTPFPEPRPNSGSRRRISELRSSAGLSLRTEEARRQSSSCSPPVRRAASGRTRQSSVRFNQDQSPEVQSPENHVTMPMTPYNRNSLVPMSRRSRASSAPRSKSNASSSASSASSSASTSASRVRFDSDTYSPPADQPSAPVTPFSKDSLVPLPRRYRHSSSTAMPKRTDSDSPTFQESITPPLTPRLVDVTPLRRSARQRRTNNAGDTPPGDVSLL